MIWIINVALYATKNYRWWSYRIKKLHDANNNSTIQPVRLSSVVMQCLYCTIPSSDGFKGGSLKLPNDTKLFHFHGEFLEKSGKLINYQLNLTNRPVLPLWKFEPPSWNRGSVPDTTYNDITRLNNHLYRGCKVVRGLSCEPINQLNVCTTSVTEGEVGSVKLV